MEFDIYSYVFFEKSTENIGVKPRITGVLHENLCKIAVPLQASSDPEGSKTLRFPDFMTTARDGGKLVILTHRLPLPQEMLLVLISVRG